jgi:hypothetical protein
MIKQTIPDVCRKIKQLDEMYVEAIRSMSVEDLEELYVDFFGTLPRLNKKGKLYRMLLENKVIDGYRSTRCIDVSNHITKSTNKRNYM